MHFALEYLPNVTDEDETPPLPLFVRDDVIRGLVRQGSLAETDVNDPVKVIEAISLFLRGMLSESTP